MQSDYPIIDWPTERPCPASAQKAGRRDTAWEKTFTSPTTLIPTTSTYSTLERKEVSRNSDNNNNNK
jgi:hypothetical protein